MTNTADRPNFWTQGYLPNGSRVSFTIPTSDNGNEAYAHALAFTNDLLAQGFLLEAPGLEAGEESELMVTVMRREKGDGTPIIDFYPAWRPGGDEPFGTYKYIHKYMNGDDDIDAFLKVSGFKSLEAIPLYDGQSPLKRTAGKKHAKETVVPSPFKIVRKQGDERTGSDGKPYRPWELVRYEPAITAPKPEQPQSAPVPQPPQPATPKNPPPAMTAQQAANGSYKANPGQFKTRALKEVYGNDTFAMNGSLKKREADGTLTDAMTVDQAIDALKNRNTGKPAPAAPPASAEWDALEATIDEDGKDIPF